MRNNNLSTSSKRVRWLKKHATQIWAALAITQALFLVGYFGYKSLLNPVGINELSPCSTKSNTTKVDPQPKALPNDKIAPTQTQKNILPKAKTPKNTTR